MSHSKAYITKNFSGTKAPWSLIDTRFTATTAPISVPALRLSRCTMRTNNPSIGFPPIEHSAVVVAAKQSHPIRLHSLPLLTRLLGRLGLARKPWREVIWTGMSMLDRTTYAPVLACSEMLLCGNGKAYIR